MERVGSLTSRHRKTWTAIIEGPVRRNLRFDQVLALFRVLGALVDEGREGSRVAVELKGKVLILHKPHPGADVKSYQVKDIRDFLFSAFGGEK